MSPWSESNASISIWASSSLEVVGTARGPSSVGRLMAVFFFFFSGKTPPFIKGEYKYIKIGEGSSFSSFGVLGVFGGLRFQDTP